MIIDPSPDITRADPGAAELDDELDRELLRSRYYGLMQELRVVVTGVQILVAFLLIAPFSERFGLLDATGRNLYGIALCASVASTVAFLTPTALHRFGERTQRSARLQVAIGAARVGLVLLAVAIEAAVLLVSRFVFDGAATYVVAGIVTITVVTGWLILPVVLRLDRR